MDTQEKDQLEVIIAELAAISQVIYRYLNNNNNINNNINNNLDLSKDLDKIKDNPSSKDIGADSDPELFNKNEQEMDIRESLKYIWKNQKLKYQVYHAVLPYTEHVRTELNVDVSNDEVWDYLCDKLNKHFSNPKRRFSFITKEFTERTSWIFNTLCNTSLSSLWMNDTVDWFRNRGSEDESIDKSPNHQITKSPTIEPGLSDFEFRVDGVRFYSDPFEKRDIEIPEDFEPRPDAESWLNPHSGWMHG